MRRVLALLVVLVVVGLAGYYLASREAAPPSNPPHPRGPSVVKVPESKFENNDYKVVKREVQVPASGDPIRHTLTSMLEAPNDERAAATPIPVGTKLLDLRVADGVATVDLSKEFAGVNQKGETTESLAQQLFRQALAQFDQVKTVRVLVEGKVFEGEHSGAWDNIPVRDDTARGGEDL